MDDVRTATGAPQAYPDLRKITAGRSSAQVFFERRAEIWGSTGPGLTIQH
jgi:hypothetical protein